ncbi:aspartyl protease family protein At5g10770-like [Typha latifolia]|uniref:aspartyl protease family protein At5g10770-like n=1 Tax=Typha latifolia TaxID=4733 RepID=UPI003C2D2DBE
MAFISDCVFQCCVFLLLLSTTLPNSSQVFGELIEAKHHHVVRMSSLLPTKVCSSSEDSSPSRLRVVHRHGPCSPSLLESKRSHEQILSQDKARVDSLHRKISTSKRDAMENSLAVSVPTHTGISLGTGNYIVNIGVGTPKKDFAVVFDTGSDLSWIQCSPCTNCYKQQDPFFDPAESSTYSNISCNSAECVQLDSASCSAESTCRYQIKYGDNSQTDGNFGRDTLTLTPSAVLPGFLFGCGNNNTGLFGRTDGLLGLGRDKVSLALQASRKYGAGFSYCLPSRASSTGFLAIGGGTSIKKVRFTRIISDIRSPSFYFLNLVAIKVGGRRLPIRRTMFSTTGTLIDSGTVITRLPPSAYSALRSAFHNLMTKYPPAPAFSILDTCYNFTGYSTVSVPKISLVFAGGVSLDVDFSGILYVLSLSQACLAFAGNSDQSGVGIIGNTQQKTFNVIYDLPNKRIGFSPKGCA